MSFLSRLCSLMSLLTRGKGRKPEHKRLRPLVEELERREVLSLAAGTFDPSSATWYMAGSNSVGTNIIAPFRYGAGLAIARGRLGRQWHPDDGCLRSLHRHLVFEEQQRSRSPGRRAIQVRGAGVAAGCR